MKTREFIERYLKGEFNEEYQAATNWVDWSCLTSSLPKRTKKIGQIVKHITNRDILNADIIFMNINSANGKYSDVAYFKIGEFMSGFSIYYRDNNANFIESYGVFSDNSESKLFKKRSKFLDFLNSLYIPKTNSSLITIKYNPNADTRTMKDLPSKEELKSASLSHIEDVSACISYIITDLVHVINNHDRDKIEDIDGFYNDVKETITKGKDFTKLDWYRKHKKENHHRIDSDALWTQMTITDVLENLVDKLTATAARQGHLNNKDIINIIDNVNPNIFKLALYNTLNKLRENINIVH